MSGRRRTTEARIAIAITLLISESLAIIARGSPVRRLTTIPATLTASMSTASRFSVRSAARPLTARTAGPTLLRASESHRLSPKAPCSR